MPVPTIVTIPYTAKPQGPMSLAGLAALMAAVPLSFDPLTNIGVSFTSDMTTIGGTTVTRNIVLSLIPPFVPLVLKDPGPFTKNGNFRGSVVSSSPNDTEFGTGARSLKIGYRDQATFSVAFPVPIPRTSLVTMKGIQPVDLVNTDHAFIESMIADSVGSLGTNDGLIQFFSGPAVGKDVSGSLVAQIDGNFQGSIVSSSPHDAAGGVGAQTVTITYKDKTGAPQAPEVVTLNGTTPVDLVQTNHMTITNMVVTTSGVFGANAGTITILTALGGAGAPAGSIGPSFFQFFPQFTNDAAGNVIPADQTAPFNDLYTHTLAAALQSFVTAGLVILS